MHARKTIKRARIYMHVREQVYARRARNISPRRRLAEPRVNFASRFSSVFTSSQLNMNGLVAAARRTYLCIRS